MKKLIAIFSMTLFLVAAVSAINPTGKYVSKGDTVKKTQSVHKKHTAVAESNHPKTAAASSKSNAVPASKSNAPARK